MMRYSIVCLIMMVFIACNPPQNVDGIKPIVGASEVKAVPTQIKPGKYSGVYAYRIGEDGPMGTILVYPNSDTSYLFYMDLSRGAPSYNMGARFGEVVMRGDTGFYSVREDEFEDCTFTFLFTEKEVKVITDEAHDDCGFGYGVYADQTYPRTDTLAPTYFINMEGDSFAFNGLTVHKYDHRND